MSRQLISRILPIFAVCLLLATAAVAELPQDKVARGTLLSIDDDSLQVRVNELGDEQMTFRIDADTNLQRDELQQGDAVIVNYEVGENPEQSPIARTVRVDNRPTAASSDTETSTTQESETTRTSTSQGSTTSEAEADVQAEAEVQAEADLDQEDDFEAEAEADFEDDSQVRGSQNQRSQNQTSRSSLPQTAGNLALFGLIGILALAGASALRFLH